MICLINTNKLQNLKPIPNLTIREIVIKSLSEKFCRVLTGRFSNGLLVGFVADGSRYSKYYRFLENGDRVEVPMKLFFDDENYSYAREVYN